MASLERHGTEVGSVFALLGDDENDLTAALGFVLARCPPLSAVFVRQIAADAGVDADGDLSLALEVRGKLGRTDLEITCSDGLFVVEAKRDWMLPSYGQLEQYVDRVMRCGSGALVTLSCASHSLARHSLPRAVHGVPVVHVSWRDVLAMIDTIWSTCRGHEKFWLQELRNYLKGVVRMRSIADCWTYCVVLNDERPAGGLSFKEIVTDHLNYFHPYGIGGWPTEPPNFMAFRWDGAVRWL